MERIGIVTKAMMPRFGTLLIITMIVFVLWIIISNLLEINKDIRGVNTALKYLGLDQVASRIMLFGWVIFLQVFIGSLNNWDNAYLLNVSDNWGYLGNLNFDDQFNTIFGFIFFGICLLFPVAWYYFLKLNRSKMDMANSAKKMESLRKDFLMINEELKEDTSPYMSYFFVCLCRRFLFALLIWCFGDSSMGTFQVFINIILSVMFSAYLLHSWVFKDTMIHYCQVINELLYLVISYH